MKWYFGVNEKGTHGGTGLHAKAAVLTAKHVGGLEPHLLYTGDRNAFTEWMESQGVTVIDITLTFIEDLVAAADRSAYSLDFIGHWLRSNIPLLEDTDPFVLYTDCDVVFLRRPELASFKPNFLASAPEFQQDNWNYFNSGVMIMNTAALRSDYRAFEQHIIGGLRSDNSANFLDQIAYNEFYRGRWSRLDPFLNWKPYWGANEKAEILHFHGPKIDSIRSVVDGTWPWHTDHGRQIGSLLAANFTSYIGAIQNLVDILSLMSFEEVSFFQVTLEKLKSLSATDQRFPIDLAFTSFRQFPD